MIRRFLTLSVCLLAALLASGRAQEMREEATPFSVWLDFQRLAESQWQRVGPPAWLESVRRVDARTSTGQPATTYRLRFRGLRDLNNDVQLRLFFEDRADAQPAVSGWSEAGGQQFVSDSLGNQTELPSSETISFPTARIDYVEITVPGDGRNIRGVFLTALEVVPMQHALDFTPAAEVIDAFGKAPATVTPANDLALLGRVRATLDPGITKLSAPRTPNGTWEFALESPPQLAVLTFEVLNSDALAPLEVTVNDQRIGTVQAQLPDLADPGYLAATRPLADGAHFRYSGWLRCQKAIPGNLLRSGNNRLVLRLAEAADSVAIRAVELQLKHPIKTVQSRFSPNLP